MSSVARSSGAIKGVRVRPWVGRMDSPIEAKFDQGIRALKFPPWERNLVFLEGRKFELDFAWPQWKAGIEIDGHVHRVKARFTSDLEKHALALLDGWTILRVGGANIRSGEAFTWAEKFLSRWWLRI